jgi:hypothetical protein
MTSKDVSQTPPFCPNPACRFHRGEATLWRYVRAGFFMRQLSPHAIQRYRCRACGRYFSDQTFRLTYWTKRPDLLRPIFHRLVSCSGARQIAREFKVSPETILRQAARLGRHALLWHESHRPRAIEEPLTLDGFESFEYSQYHPTAWHVAAGQVTHFFYGFTDSELRRKGSMTRGQRLKRERVEAEHGRPDPKSIEKEVAGLLRILAPKSQPLELHTDEHPAYPRALRRVPHLAVNHHTISSRAARTAQNPLFPINLLDLLIRHSGSNHKRETIAASKRRQCAAERMAIFLIWRNYMKWFSERKKTTSPAMRLGIIDHLLDAGEVLNHRLFPTRIELPDRWQDYYWRRIVTRMIPNGSRHEKRYAM